MGVLLGRGVACNVFGIVHHRDKTQQAAALHPEEKS